MVNNNQFQSFEEETIDFKAYLNKLLKFWYVFPVSILLGLIISFVVIKTTSPVYRVGSSILIKDEQSLMDPDAIIQSVVSPYSSMAEYKLKNEIEILSSYFLTERTIRELNFNVSYYEKEKFRVNEIYNRTPFIIEYDSAYLQPAEIEIYIQKLKNGKFHVWTEAKEALAYLFSEEKVVDVFENLIIDDTIPADEYFIGRNFKIKIKELTEIDIGKIYIFRFRTLESLVVEFQQKQIEGIKYSSIVKIFYDGENASKSIDFLNKLIDVYLNRGVEKKNKIAINTIDFINSQINAISDSLMNAENNLEKYKSSQKVMNIDFQSQQSYQNLESLQTQKAELLLKHKYYTYLKEYLSENKDFQDIIAPSSMGISDALLNSLIIELNSLYSEKVDVMVNSKKDNPYLESVKIKIENQKNTLLENILNSTRELYVESLGMSKFGLMLKRNGGVFHLLQHHGISELTPQPLNSFQNLSQYFSERKTNNQRIVLERQDFSSVLEEDAAIFINESIFTIVPLMINEQIIGLLLFGLKQTGAQFTGKDLDLLISASNQTAISIENARLYHSEIEKNRLERDLENARHIQQSLLPKSIPEINRLELTGVTIPAQHVGGDYYDFIKLSDTKLFIVVGDVSGKGLSAALYISKLQTMIRLYCSEERSPKEILVEINKRLFAEMERNYFITVSLALIDSSERKVRFCRAGHPHALLINDGKCEKIKPVGIGLGLNKGEVFDVSLEETEITLEPGSLLAVYSDGISEAMNSKQQEFGEEIASEYE